MNVFILFAKITKHCLHKLEIKKKNLNLIPITWELGNTDAGEYIWFLTCV